MSDRVELNTSISATESVKGVGQTKDLRSEEAKHQFALELDKKLAEEKKISAFHHKGFWKCMNTMKDKIELESLISNNKIPWLRQ